MVKASFLWIKFNKTRYVYLRTKNCIDTTLDINCCSEIIFSIKYKNYLCLVTYVSLTCNNYIDQLISKLMSACLG